MQFKRSIYQCPVFQNEEQEEKERLERIDLLHQQASAKNLNKTFY